MNIGERIGDYEIVEVLGAGGMGQVYKVRNVLSDRLEAMKVLLPKLEADPGLADRFLREIKVQAALDHPNIAKLHTALRADNQLLMVMEFVDGVSIEQMLAKGPIAYQECVVYAAQVLDALAYAHAHGVIHRDIKPANIMVTSAASSTPGIVKLMDFGIARMKADQRLTQTGCAVGSLHYMSPEQIQGAEPDPRSDLYSLGVTLYQMVTGQRPFQGDSDYSIMAAHLQHVPAPTVDMVPGVPVMLSEIIAMSMAKDPAGRFQSAVAFRGALQSLMPSAAAPTKIYVPQAAATVPIPVPAAPTVALPVAAPPVFQPAPPSMPPPKPAGRRGLYMAIGAVAALGVVAAALVEAPKFIGTRANTGHDAVSDVPAPPPASPVQAPAAAPTAASPEAVPQSAPVATPVQQQSPVPQQQVAPLVDRPRRTPAASAPATSAPVSQPPAAAPAVVEQAPPPAQPQAQAQPPRPSPEMRELREQHNLLAVRAATARSGLRSIEQQMSRQGLGLRGDIKEAEARMNYQLQEATESLRSGDTESAKKSLQMAEYALQTIEKFLGR